MPKEAHKQNPVTVEEVYQTILKNGVEYSVEKSFDVTLIEHDRLRELCLQAKRVNAQIRNLIEDLWPEEGPGSPGFPGWY